MTITNLLPRQISAHLQPRRIVIQQSTDALLWQILQIECFDSQTKQELSFEPDNKLGTPSFKTIQEFDKYDVNILHVKDQAVKCDMF